LTQKGAIAQKKGGKTKKTMAGGGNEVWAGAKKGVKKKGLSQIFGGRGEISGIGEKRNTNKNGGKPKKLEGKRGKGRGGKKRNRNVSKKT